ncbi:vWA domain-containing protein [Clostridium sp.]|uniref:vWA domain-containing protein n=1 Tax=Clostridium sp. TaxID=1506 RepID=UPI0039949D5D
MDRSKLFKKLGIVLGTLGIVTIGVIGTSLVKASEDNPNMSIEVLVKDDKNTIKTFVSKEFTIDIKVNPDKIKYESANTATAIRGSKLVLESKEFEIVSSTVGTIDKNSVDLGEFKYAYDGIGFNVGTSFDVTLKIRALKEGSYNENKSFNKLIKLYHKNASGNDAKVKIDDADNKLNVIVDKVNYENPKIMGGEFLTNKQENGEGNKIVAFGELLELNYHLIPSEIMTSEKVQNTQGDGSRKLIYVLDESTLSKNNEGSQSSKEALIKSLNDLKANNPKQEVALVTYGSKAKVVKASEKSFYTIDELIRNINEISSEEKNGNLGDALRQAQYLINENKDDKISVILVSEGNPAYFTRKDDSNNLVEFSTKSGELGTNFNEGKEYVEEIAELINKENKKNKRDIRWFNINYGLEEEQMLSNEVIKTLGGETENEVMPTELDFEKVVKNATSDLIVNMEIKAEGYGKVKVAPESNKQVIAVHYNYKKDDKGEVVINEKKQKTLIPVTTGEVGTGESLKKTIPFKVGLKFMSDTELDLADPKVLKVSVNSSMEGSKEVVFNVLENAEGSETISWKADPEVNYLKITGLHNGKLENFKVAKDGIYNVESLEYMQVIASQIFDGINSSEFPMAKENTFRSGALVEVNAKSNIELNLKDINGKSNIRENDVKWEVYEYNIGENKFVKKATKAYKDVKILEANKLYLVVTDCFIPEDAEIDASFNIGYSITVEKDEPNDPALNGGVEMPSSEPSVEEALLPGSNEVVQEENLYEKYFLEERTRDNEDKSIAPIKIETKIIIKDKPNHY